jgi:hypothetical protein
MINLEKLLIEFKEVLAKIKGAIFNLKNAFIGIGAGACN